MTRNYADRPVDAASIDRITRAAASAPTAGNSQGTSVVVVTDPQTRRAIALAADEPSWLAKGYPPWLSSAPLHLVVCGDPGAYAERYRAPDKRPKALEIPWWWFDAGAMLGLVLATVKDCGLAAGFLGGHRLGLLHEVLGIPADVLIAGLITVGHPAPDPETASAEWRGGRRTHTGSWNK